MASVGPVEATIERAGGTNVARRYYLGSAKLDAETFAAVRAHWGVENNLHWVMDVVFHDDLMRLRTGYGPANMATVRHIVLNLLRDAPGKQSLTVRRKLAGWNEAYLATVITRVQT